MKYGDIRNAFKKCGILVSNGGISLLFPPYSPPRWITMAIDNEDFQNKTLFMELLRICDSVSIVTNPGKSNRFMFNMGIPVESDLLFPPVKEEISAEELPGIVFDTLKTAEFTEEFTKTFNDIDIHDAEEVKLGFRELIDKTEFDEPYNISGLQRWKSTRESAMEFIDAWDFKLYSVTPPDQDIDFGTIDLYFKSNNRRVFEITNELMPNFIKAVESCNFLSLDSNSSGGISDFVISFFS